jgi:hypothetical protein
VNRDIVFRIIKSLIITLAVSTTIAYFLTNFNFNFFSTFSIAVIVQFLIFYFYGEYVKNNNYKFLLKVEKEIAIQRNKQTATVLCPCDRRVESIIPINVEGPNSYICPGCEKQISVFVETKTALSTEPVVNNPLDAPLLIDQIEKMAKQK